jgi:hypothetical protein
MAGDAPEINLKTARLLESYGLGESFGRQLEPYWTGEQGERKSLRTLADLFNRRLLEAAIVQAGGSPKFVEVDRFYETLTGEASSSGERREVKQRLGRIGVEVDEVVGDFVSYQAIRSYLKEVRGVDYRAAEPDTGNSREAATSAVRKLRSRLEAVTESSLWDARQRRGLHDRGPAS